MCSPCSMNVRDSDTTKAVGSCYESVAEFSSLSMSCFFGVVCLGLDRSAVHVGVKCARIVWNDGLVCLISALYW